jgi:hypothetical protein
VKGSLKAIAFFGLGNQKTGNCGRRKLDYHLKGVKGGKQERTTTSGRQPRHSSPIKPPRLRPGGHGELSLAIHHGIPQKVAQLETQGATYEGPMPLMT